LAIECGMKYQKHNLHALNLGVSSVPMFKATTTYEKLVYGKGSIVTVADTGLDVNHCYFRDIGKKIPMYTLTRRNAMNTAKILQEDNKLPNAHSRIFGYLALQFRSGNASVHT